MTRVMRCGLLAGELLLTGCASGGLASGELPQAPGTVRPGQQARYTRPADAAAPKDVIRPDAPPAAPQQTHVLFGLLLGLGALGMSTFIAERASRRGQREE